MFFIYLIKNTINHKLYVGKTINIKNRWASHKSEARYNRKNQALYLAMRKHGIDNFYIEEIYCSKYEVHINDIEKYFIGFYDTYGANGYNMTLGGEGAKTGPRSEEFKRRVSLATKGKKKSMQGRKNMSIAAKLRCENSPSPFKGKSHTVEAKRKCGSQNKGTFWTTNGIDNLRLQADQIIPEGFYRGRKV